MILDIGAQTSGLFGPPGQPSLSGDAGVNTGTAYTSFGFPAPAFGAMSQPTATSDLSPKPMASIGATSTTSGASSFKSTTTTSNSFGANTQAKPFEGAQTSGLFRPPAQPSLSGDAGVNTSTANTGFSSPSTSTGLFGSQQNANTSRFGGNNPPPAFGQATKPAPFSFGGSIDTGLFGQAQQPAQQTALSLFGPSDTTANTSLFGNTSGFSSPSTSTGLFGSQQNANTSRFGGNNPPPAFGQATKPAPFSFGGSIDTGLFGQAQQPAQQTALSLFGPSDTTANTSLFGNTSGFTGNNTAGGMTGTVVQFSPLPDYDTMMMNGVTHTISTRHYCISCMKEYEGKSMEELRLEDYIAGRKGLFQGFGSTTPAFGATSQPAATSGLFAKPMAGFGATATTSSAFPFNSTITTSNPFGANTQAKPFVAPASVRIGDSPLFKHLLPASGKTEDHLKPADATVPTFNSSKYKIATNNNSLKAKVGAIRNAQLSKKSLFEGLEEEDPALQEAFQSRARAKRLAMRSKPISATDVQFLDRVVTTLNIKESQPSRENVVETIVA